MKFFEQFKKKFCNNNNNINKNDIITSDILSDRDKLANEVANTLYFYILK